MDLHVAEAPGNIVGQAMFAPLETPAEQWPEKILHYTSAAGLYGIVSDKSLLLSGTSTMNDSDEIVGSLRIIREHLPKFPPHTEWVYRMNKLWPEFLPAFAQFFNSVAGSVSLDVYISCWCEFERVHPDGKLSMWRAYGADGRGNALVFKTKPVLDSRETTNIPLRFFKTRYENDEEFCRTLQACADAVLDHIQDAKAYAAEHGLQLACDKLFQAWFSAAVTRKHPGFVEENEWRLLYLPAWDNDGHFGDYREVGVVGEQLKPRYRIPIVDYALLGSPATDLNALLDHVVVGPNTLDKISAWKGAEILLRTAGIVEPEKRVRVCNTPYRST